MGVMFRRRLGCIYEGAADQPSIAWQLISGVSEILWGFHVKIVTRGISLFSNLWLMDASLAVRGVTPRNPMTEVAISETVESFRLGALNVANRPQKARSPLQVQV